VAFRYTPPAALAAIVIVSLRLSLIFQMFSSSFRLLFSRFLSSFRGYFLYFDDVIFRFRLPHAYAIVSSFISSLLISFTRSLSPSVSADADFLPSLFHAAITPVSRRAETLFSFSFR